jgi:Outer membrane protein beta-barrel domain/Lipid A 3-O-deacylase (PagL)
MKISSFILLVIFNLVLCINISAQENKAQIPKFLQQSYFEVNVGSINYPFSASNFENIGYSLTTAVEVPHIAARIVLAGYEFNKYLSAQITYMRPVIWVKYRYKEDIQEYEYLNSVWMNVGGLTIKPSLPIGKNFSLYGEIGLGLITRHGFDGPDGKPLISDARFGTFLLGSGFKYHMNEHWALQVCSNYSPASKSQNQPYTSFIGTGFSYKFSKFSDEQLLKTEATGYVYPNQWIQIGLVSNVLGYGVNKAISGAYLFWGGNTQVSQGLSINYQRNIFHGAKVFALDWGFNTAIYQTNINKETFFTLSLFPVFRLNLLHTKPVDAYFFYSVAGPTFISKVILDDLNTGAHFTFQDTMGAGVFFGKKRNYVAEMKIGHYSNGNIYPYNESVMVPLSLSIGYAF